MNCAQALLSLFLLSPCGEGGGDIPEYIADALESPNRLAADRDKDTGRRPADVLAFLELRPGDHVLDLFAGGGYYTSIVSEVVGPSGSVTSQNNEAYLAYAADELEERFGDGAPENVVRLTSEASDLELPVAGFDAVLAILTWHDFYYVDEPNGWPRIDAAAMVSKLCQALKPGGVLGVVDHVAATGSAVEETAQTLHRIDPARVRADLDNGCFEFAGEARFLRNATDDHSVPMFDESVRGKTDRFVYKFRRT